jgi:hypothetical protein
MESRIIYRMQNDDGYGPYGASVEETGITSMDWARKSDPGHDCHPSPGEDGIRDMPPSWLCGFDSPEMLFDWFDKEEIETLSNLGFHVFEIKLGDINWSEGKFAIEEGDHQLIFDPGHILSDNGEILYEGGHKSC